MKTLAFFTSLLILMAIVGNCGLQEWEHEQKTKLEKRQNIFDKLSEKL